MRWASLVVVVAVIALAVWLLNPPLDWGSGHARLRARSNCGANLNQIGKQLIVYTTEYEEIPPDIDTLIRHGMSEAVLKCPSADGNRKSDYFFHFPGEEPDVGSTLVACDYRGNHRDGRNVLTYQGSVRFYKGEAAFQAELAQPYNADFAKALRQVEGP